MRPNCKYYIHAQIKQLVAEQLLCQVNVVVVRLLKPGSACAVSVGWRRAHYQ